jgi:large subunit ribosomal protein L53
MLTKYLTSVTTAFSPFNPKSGKTARNFLALLPPTAHKTMTIDVKVLSQAQKIVPATLALKFSMFESGKYPCQFPEERMPVDVLKVLLLTTILSLPLEDGKEMNLDLEKMKIREIQTEVDRHSRQLLRQEELNG